MNTLAVQKVLIVRNLSVVFRPSDTLYRTPKRTGYRFTNSSTFFLMAACSDLKAECSSDKSRRRMSPSRSGAMSRGPHRRHCYGIITDATSACSAGGAAPSNIQVLAGVAGGTLVNVMTSATNTGIGSNTQCVFHVTIAPGAGVPSAITDIVVVTSNAGAALSGVNTITASAAVR